MSISLEDVWVGKREERERETDRQVRWLFRKPRL